MKHKVTEVIKVSESLKGSDPYSSFNDLPPAVNTEREVIRLACFKVALMLSHPVMGATVVGFNIMGDVWPQIHGGESPMNRVIIEPVGRDGDVTKGTPHYLRITYRYGRRRLKYADDMMMITEESCAVILDIVSQNSCVVELETRIKMAIKAAINP
jgi:hypothetical protein